MKRGEERRVRFLYTLLTYLPIYLGTYIIFSSFDLLSIHLLHPRNFLRSVANANQSVIWACLVNPFEELTTQ